MTHHAPRFHGKNQSEEPDTGGYQRTWLDRQGPDGALAIRAITTAGIMFFVMLLVWGLVAKQQGLDGWRAAVCTLGGALASAWVVYWVSFNFSGAAGAVAKSVTLPSGESTPYEEQYSWQESLAARGDIAGALESYEAVIGERPGAVAPRQRAAELYAQNGRDPHRAAALFREIRESSQATVRDRRYASSRLVDLYDGPLADPGRAVVELRRLIEHFPGSPEAAFARDALPRLKRRMAEERGEA